MRVRFIPILALALGSAVIATNAMAGYVETNLASDQLGLAANQDMNLVNPWGIAESPTSPFWISDNGTGLASVYNSGGVSLGSVHINLPGGGPAAPSGQVFNGTTSFNGDPFIFSTEDGLIAGWRPALGGIGTGATVAETLDDMSGSNAVFKGIALGSIGSSNYLYATDFHNNQIDVLPGSGAPALTGNFSAPDVPAGFAPFNIENINGMLYVTYAKQDSAKHDDVAGPGNGLVNVFDLNGNFVQQLTTGGVLNSPWGIAIAPASFGTFGGDLLIGNFGDGTINAFTLNGTFAGTLSGPGGSPLVTDGLWGLIFGNGSALGGSPDTLYFTAGPNQEADGLFGQITPTPEPGTIGLLAAGLAGLAFGKIRLSRRRAG